MSPGDLGLITGEMPRKIATHRMFRNAPCLGLQCLGQRRPVLCLPLLAPGPPLLQCFVNIIHPHDVLAAPQPGISIRDDCDDRVATLQKLSSFLKSHSNFSAEISRRPCKIHIA